MKKLLILCFMAGSAATYGQSLPLEGFAYAPTPAPDGKEWQDPERLALNKEQPHAWFFTFPDTESARRVLPEAGAYYLSLDGVWKFHWAGNPEERPAEFYKPGYDGTTERYPCSGTSPESRRTEV